MTQLRSLAFTSLVCAATLNAAGTLAAPSTSSSATKQQQVGEEDEQLHALCERPVQPAPTRRKFSAWPDILRWGYHGRSKEVTAAGDGTSEYMCECQQGFVNTDSTVVNHYIKSTLVCPAGLPRTTLGSPACEPCPEPVRASQQDPRACVYQPAPCAVACD
jgi:hypothetical protein